MSTTDNETRDPRDSARKEETSELVKKFLI